MTGTDHEIIEPVASQRSVPGDSLVDRALAAASCQLSPQLLEVSPSSSSVLAGAVHCVQCVHLYSPRTRPGLSGTVQCAGAGTGAGSDQSGYSERGEHTASVTVSVTTVLLQSERESPALGSVHQLAPEPSVRACALCVHRNWK